MTDEINVTETTEHKCLCQSKGFRNFVVITAGTFTGVFLALSLFAALHKPPMMIPMNPGFNRGIHGCPCQRINHHGFKQNFNKDDFQKYQIDKKAPRDINRRAPFEAPRPQ